MTIYSSAGVTICIMPPRIGPRKPVNVFLAQWREYIGVSQQDLGNRFDPPVAKGTVSRWEKTPATVSLGVVSAYAEALGPKVKVTDLYRLPPPKGAPKPPPSLDDLAAGLDEEAREEAAKVIQILARRRAS